MNDAENNLWNFYRRIGQQKNYSFYKSNFWSVVTAPPEKWPHMIFDLDIRNGRNIVLEMMADEIKNMELPHQFIAGSDLFGPETQSVLRRNHFAPVEKWTIMEIDPLSVMNDIPFNRNQDPGFENPIRQITGSLDLKEFSKIVNSELFRNLPVDTGLLKDLTETQDFSVYGSFDKGEILSGLLVFICNNVAGIYLVATKKEKQRQGYGIRLLTDMINRMKYSGISKIVLHSSAIGVPFYKNAGFSVTGEMYIYRYFSE